MSSIPPIIVQVKAQLDDFKKDMGKVSSLITGAGDTAKKESKSFGGLGGQLKGLRNAAIGAFAIRELGQIISKAGHAAVEESKSMAMMTRTVKASTGATDAQMDSVNKGIDKLELLSAVADDKIRPAFTLLARQTGDTGKALDLMGLALDVSAGTGKSLTAVSMALSRAMNGSQNALNRIVPEAKNVSDKIGYMRKVFTGAAEAAAKKDPYQRMAVIFDRMNEIIGEGLIPVLNTFADWLQSIIPMLEKFFKRLNDPTTDTGSAWKAMVDTITNFAKWVLTNIGLIIRWGAVLGAIFLVFKIGAGIIAAFRIVVTLAAIAQYAWNAAMNANPIMLVVGAIGLLTAAVIGYNLAASATNTADTGTDFLTDQTAAYDKHMSNLAKIAAFKKTMLKTVDEQTYESLFGGLSIDQIYGLNIPGPAFPKAKVAGDKAYKAKMAEIQAIRDARTNPNSSFVMPAVAAPIAALETYASSLFVKPEKFIEEKFGRIQTAVIKKGEEIQGKITEAIASGDITSRAGTALSQYATKEIGILGQIGQARDYLATKYDLAKTLMGTVGEQIKSLMSIENLGNSAQSAIASFTTITDRILSFAKNLKTLKSQNVNLDFISEIAKAGIEGGSALAQGLASSTPEQIQAVNDAYLAVKLASSAAQESIAQTIYGDGVDVTKGLLAGIISQDQVLIKTAEDMGLRFSKTFAQASKLALTSKSDSAFAKSMAKFEAENLPAGLVSPSGSTTATGDVSIVNNYNVSNQNSTNASPDQIAQNTVSAIKFGLPQTLTLAGVTP